MSNLYSCFSSVVRDKEAWAPCYHLSQDEDHLPFHQVSHRILCPNVTEDNLDREGSPLTDLDDVEETLGLVHPGVDQSMYIFTSELDMSKNTTNAGISRHPSNYIDNIHCIDTTYDSLHSTNTKFGVPVGEEYRWTVRERSRASNSESATDFIDLKQKVSTFFLQFKFLRLIFGM
jgi:hypothetical protein